MKIIINNGASNNLGRVSPDARQLFLPTHNLIIPDDEVSRRPTNEVHRSAKPENPLFVALDVFPTEITAQGAVVDTIMTKVAIIADLQPALFQRKYKFKCWRKEVYPLAILCAINGAPQELLKVVYEHHPPAADDAMLVACASASNDKESDMAILKWLHSISPDSIQRADSLKRLPLHVVCLESKCLKIVEFIYDAYPEGLTEGDKWSRTPLHCAFRFSSLAIIEYLLSHMLNDVKEVLLSMKDNQGFTPLHCAFLNKRKEVSQFVIKMHPKFAKSKPDPKFGWLPLHYACYSSDRFGAGIRVLLEQYPNGAKKKDKRGRLPLRLACMNLALLNHNKDLIELIRQCYPDAIDSVNKHGNRVFDVETTTRLIKHKISWNEDDALPGKRQRTG